MRHAAQETQALRKTVRLYSLFPKEEVGPHKFTYADGLGPPTTPNVSLLSPDLIDLPARQGGGLLLYFTFSNTTSMMPLRSSVCRLAVSISLRMPARRIHIDTARLGQQDTSEVLSDMISSGTHSSTERINRFMNSVYINTPRSVSLFSFNFRQQTERSTIRGILLFLLSSLLFFTIYT